MKVKTFYAWNEKTMDRKVNEFLENASLEIVDIKYATPVFYFSAMVIYKDPVSSKEHAF